MCLRHTRITQPADEKETSGNHVGTPRFFALLNGKKHSPSPLAPGWLGGLGWAGWLVGWAGLVGWLSWLAGWLAGWVWNTGFDDLEKCAIL